MNLTSKIQFSEYLGEFHQKKKEKKEKKTESGGGKTIVYMGDGIRLRPQNLICFEPHKVRIVFNMCRRRDFSRGPVMFDSLIVLKYFKLPISISQVKLICSTSKSIVSASLYKLSSSNYRDNDCMQFFLGMFCPNLSRNNCQTLLRLRTKGLGFSLP